MEKVDRSRLSFQSEESSRSEDEESSQSDDEDGDEFSTQLTRYYFSPNGSKLIILEKDVNFYEVETGKLLRKISFKDVFSIKWSPKGNYVLIRTIDHLKDTFMIYLLESVEYEILWEEKIENETETKFIKNDQYLIIESRSFYFIHNSVTGKIETKIAAENGFPLIPKQDPLSEWIIISKSYPLSVVFYNFNFEPVKELSKYLDFIDQRYICTSDDISDTEPKIRIYNRSFQLLREFEKRGFIQDFNSKTLLMFYNDEHVIVNLTGDILYRYSDSENKKIYSSRDLDKIIEINVDDRGSVISTCPEMILRCPEIITHLYYTHSNRYYVLKAESIVRITKEKAYKTSLYSLSFDENGYTLPYGNLNNLVYILDIYQGVLIKIVGSDLFSYMSDRRPISIVSSNNKYITRVGKLIDIKNLD